MAQVKTAHSGLQSFGRVIGFLLLFIFILLVPIYTVLFGISRTLLSQKYLETTLMDGVVRTEALGFAQVQLSAASLNQMDQNGESSTIESSVADSPQVKNFLDETVSESSYNTVVHTILSNAFGYLRGEVELENISIDTKDLQKSVISGLQRGIVQLPVCGPHEVSILSSDENTSADSATALCKPKGKSDAELTKFTQNAEFTNMISTSIPSTLKLKDLPNFDEIHYQATQVRHYYSELMTSVIYGGIALILALIVGSFLWHQHLWYGLQTLGITLFIPFASLYAMTFFGHVFFERLVVNNAITQDPTGIHVVAVVWHVASPILLYISNYAGLIALFGLVLFVIMEVIRHIAAKRGLNHHTEYAFAQAPKPTKTAKKRA